MLERSAYIICRILDTKLHSALCRRRQRQILAVKHLFHEELESWIVVGIPKNRHPMRFVSIAFEFLEQSRARNMMTLRAALEYHLRADLLACYIVYIILH